MPYTLDISHVDTCLPCYVLDHCNGDSEQLIGIPVDRSTRMYQVKDSLIDEIRAHGDKIPESIGDEQIAKAVKECMNGVHPLKSFDSGLDKSSEYDDGDSCYAWFRITWESEE